MSDAFLFGSLKAHAQLFEASNLLIDENGNRKSLQQLEQELNKLNIDYNNNYLEAEYQFATSSSVMADKWNTFSDRYDLQYRTAKDSRVREEHQVLHGITLPKEDPFWEEYYPPNGWRCRCTVVQVRKGKYEASDSKKAIEAGKKATSQIGKDGSNRLAMFRFNAGKDQNLFPSNHPYTKVKGADKVNGIVERNTTIELNTLIKKEIPTNAEIKNILNKYAEEFPTDFRNGLDKISITNSGSYLMQHSMAYKPSTGEWTGGSKISLSRRTFNNGFNPAEDLRGAFGAIKKGVELTFNQEYAIESLWHEILHAKTKTKPKKLNRFQVQNMETINQFVARHTYGDFLKRLGGKAYHQTKILDEGYGYANWVTDFRNKLKSLEITEESAVDYFTPHLMNDYGTIGKKIQEFFKQK